MLIKTIDDGKKILKKHYDKQLEVAKASGVEKYVWWVQTKYAHSLDVFEIAKYLVKNDLILSKLDEKYKLYGLLGALLHDIGRAYEIGDVKINGLMHGYFGAENILKDMEGEDDPFILLSFKYHDILDAEEQTKKELRESNLSAKEQEIVIILLKLVMDSDKLSNFKLFQDCDRNFLLSLNDNMYITQTCLDSFKKKELIIKKDRQTNLDQYLSYLSWVYDINFQASKDLISKENYMGGLIKRMLDEVKELTSISSLEEIKKLLMQLNEISQQLENDGFLNNSK